MQKSKKYPERPKTLAEKQEEIKKALQSSRQAARQDVKNDPIQIVKKEIHNNPLNKETKQWMIQAVAAQVAGIKSKSEIAKLLQMNRGVVTDFLNSPEAKKVRDHAIDGDYLTELKKRVRILANKSVDLVAEELFSTDPAFRKERIKLAMDILDRAGVRESEKKEVKHTHILEGIKEAINRASKKEEKRARELQAGNA